MKHRGGMYGFTLLLTMAVCYIGFRSYRRAHTRTTIEATLKGEHWMTREKEFEKEERSEHKIVFLGNSLTEYFDLDKFGVPGLLNRGISGDFTEGALKRLDEVIALKPSRVFIELGINDIVEKVPLDELTQNYSNIIHRLQKACPGVKLYIQNNLPVNMRGSFLTSNEDINALVREQNKNLKGLAGGNSLTYIDLHSHFLKDGALDMDLSTDGIHLNDKGYAIWRSVVEEYLK
jgi:lysophospholipase L1-like esterase